MGQWDEVCLYSFSERFWEMKQNPEAGGKGSEFCLARLEPTARQGSHRVDGESVETPPRGCPSYWAFCPECRKEGAGHPPGGLRSQLERFAEHRQVISSAPVLSCLCLARIPGEGSIVQPEVGCVFILPNLLKDLAGRGSCIPEPEPRGPSFCRIQEEPSTWGLVVQPA